MYVSYDLHNKPREESALFMYTPTCGIVGSFAMVAMAFVYTVYVTCDCDVALTLPSPNHLFI